MVDENIHYMILKLLYGAKNQRWTMRAYLRYVPVVYGVWHAYKFVVTHIFRAFWPVLTYLRKSLLRPGSTILSYPKVRYMLEADQTEQRATAATWDTQEEWLQRGIPLWVLDSNRGHEGHQQVHAAEAAQEDVVTEAPAEETEPVAPAPTLPMQPKVKKTAKVISTQGTAAGEGTPSSSKKQAK